MNGKQARRVRKRVYGEYSPRYRRYEQDAETKVITADSRREGYQYAKERWKRHALLRNV